MTWCVQKLNPMTEVGQEGHATPDRFQNAANPFIPEVLVNPTACDSVTNAIFAAVCIQIIRDQSVAWLPSLAWCRFRQDGRKENFLGKLIKQGQFVLAALASSTRLSITRGQRRHHFPHPVVIKNRVDIGVTVSAARQNVF